MSSTNIATLTKSHHAIAAKKRSRATQLHQVVFDDDARREFLTGFHKRKLAKQAAARKKAQERDKQAHLEARRQQRQALREQAAANAAQVEKAYGGVQDDFTDEQDDEWNGIPSGNQEAEYEGEAVVATVTVVDDFDPTEIIHGPSRTKSPPLGDPFREDDSSSAARSSRLNDHHPRSKSTTQTALTAQTATSKFKPKNIKYETNAARKAQRVKQRARRTEKAERAGGKASRKRSTNNKGKRR